MGRRARTDRDIALADLSLSDKATHPSKCRVVVCDSHWAYSGNKNAKWMPKSKDVYIYIYIYIYI